MIQYLALPGTIVALLTIAIILFKFSKAGIRAVIAIDTLIRSIEANTLAQTKTARTVERFRKATKAEIAGLKGQIEELDSRLDDLDHVLSPPSLKKAG